ncbi:hypothetical protein [Yokenella regensburgei]|uniref:hypothetical protein n=1 Tax=Yokenella regensburgei TaxID=158877 RepID=UPI003ED9D176
MGESFFVRLKKWTRKHIYKTRGLARLDIIDFIEAFYTGLSGVSPEVFEQTSP